MNREFSGVTLNGTFFTSEDLLLYAEKMIKSGRLPKWEDKIYRFILSFLDDQDFIEQQSSGTTGTPKKFQLSKQAMIESARNTINALGLKSKEAALLCLPIDYIAGKMMVVRALVGDFCLYWEEPSSTPLLDKYDSIGFCAMVPLQVYNSIENPASFKKIENLIIGGSELRSDVKEILKDLPNAIYETYGMAETCSHIALRKISGGSRDKYFKTLPGISVSVDHRSCLIISASYMNDPVVTNDVVELVDENNFIWKGRFDNLINSGGIKINQEELEALISEIITKEFAVIGVPDTKFGQRVVLFVETSEEINRDELFSILKEKLPAHHVPREIVTVSKLPRNKSFKIDRTKLKELKV
uniref:AMP-binding protein n=1 Tax=uncultured Draconibacterium sp. TaxID=1573823 RepID=UPI0032173469